MVEEHGADVLLDFKFNPADVDEDTQEVLSKFNSVKLTKDNFDALISISFEMNLSKD